MGAHLVALTRGDSLTGLYYWRDRVRGVDLEVDYVLKRDNGVTGVEVKSGASAGSLAGLTAFGQAYVEGQTLVVGIGGMSLERFLESEWVRL